ncbi:MAG: hypothetical protein JXA90_15870 [Planctomycetes bacterium]|nr:hypothetical protein [Planctomycetota bacterium]
MHAEPAGFYVDEAPLREWILKAYHEQRKPTGDSFLLIEALRDLLSGPPGGPSVPGSYHFETDPASSVSGFARSLDAVSGGLAGAVYGPILKALRRRGGKGEAEIVENPSLFVASLSGSIALRSSLDETIASALVSAALLTVARQGKDRVAGWIGET